MNIVHRNRILHKRKKLLFQVFFCFFTNRSGGATATGSLGHPKSSPKTRHFSRLIAGYLDSTARRGRPALPDVLHRPSMSAGRAQPPAEPLAQSSAPTTKSCAKRLGEDLRHYSALILMGRAIILPAGINLKREDQGWKRNYSANACRSNASNSF